MRITSIRLKNFKRFSDLVVRDVPAEAKVVVVVGPNGCGKSSLFDALLQWYKLRVGFGHNNDMLYYRKADGEAFDWNRSVEVELAAGAKPAKGCLYVRTAYRNDPDFSIGGINRPNAPSESARISRVIDNDQTVSDNYQRLVYDTMAAVYDTGNDAKNVAALREELIGSVRASMNAVFGDLVLNSITDPLGSGAFYFEKGVSTAYHYKNLSGGEKAAFDFILDLHVKKKFFADAVYCIDELETHLHTRVQGQLLKELVSILPESAQLWITTHSLGVLRAAQQLNADTPGLVSVIDFDGVDPDVPREIVPCSLGRVTWDKLLSIALDDLSSRVAPKVLVVCEGSSVGNRRRDFDAEIYNRVLGSHQSDIVFVSGGSSTQVARNGVEIGDALAKVVPTTKVVALCDRDSKSDQEVFEYERNGNLVLPLRNLESYLFADEVLLALASILGKEELHDDILRIKQEALDQSILRGNPPDDLKSAAGQIYTELKRYLALERSGNTTDAFMRDTLAPLVQPGMQTYQQLHDSIVARLDSV